MKVILHVEGGGETNALKKRCRQGFRKFLEEAGLKGRMPHIIACGSRNDAYDDFRTATENAGTSDFPMLLVDSEDAVETGGTCWRHLYKRDGWGKPENAEDNQAHLMVKCMESWFLGDKDAVAKYYGKGFKQSALSANAHPEHVDKGDVLDGLKNATRNTTKGVYHKGKHSFDILAVIDPAKVRKACPHAGRLLRTLERVSE